MPVLRNARHERFCQLLASGKSAVAAYREAAGKRAGKPENDHVHSAEWKRARGVRERLRELMEANSKRSTLTREEALMFLTRVIMTPAGDVGPHDSLCQSHKVTSGDGWEVHEVKVPDKLGAVMQLSRMCNWNSPEEVRLSASDSLKAYLLELRAQPIGSWQMFKDAGDLTPPIIELQNGQGANE